jgi:hypothetical protein
MIIDFCRSVLAHLSMYEYFISIYILVPVYILLVFFHAKQLCSCAYFCSASNQNANRPYNILSGRNILGPIGRSDYVYT